MTFKVAVGAAALGVPLFFATQAVSADICTALLAQGIRDTSSTQVSEARFNELKSNVCNSNYDSYSKAAQQAITGAFDMPGVFGISFGSSNATTDYATKWANFCQSDYARATSNSELKTYFSTANRAVLNSFDNCVNATTERFIRYVEPQSDGGTYSITFNNRRQGDATFKVISISLTNSSSGQAVDVLQACDVPPPFRHDLPWDTASVNLNAFSMVCRRNASDRVVVAGTTSAGNIDPVVVQPVPNPGPSIADRVSAVEGNVQATSASLQSLNQKVASDEASLAGTIDSKIAAIGTGPDVPTPAGGNGGTQTCPPGSFLVAVHSQIDSGGPHGITSWLYAVCRKVK